MQGDEVDLGIRPPQATERGRGAAGAGEPLGRHRRIGAQRGRGRHDEPAGGRERAGRIDVEREQAPLQRGGIGMHQQLGHRQPLSERRTGARIPARQRQVDRRVQVRAGRGRTAAHEGDPRAVDLDGDPGAVPRQLAWQRTEVHLAAVDVAERERRIRETQPHPRRADGVVLELVDERRERRQRCVGGPPLQLARRAQHADPRALLVRGRQRGDHRVRHLHHSGCKLGPATPLDQARRGVGVTRSQEVAGRGEIVAQRARRPAVQLADAAAPAPPQHTRQQELAQQIVRSRAARRGDERQAGAHRLLQERRRVAESRHGGDALRIEDREHGAVLERLADARLERVEHLFGQVLEDRLRMGAAREQREAQQRGRAVGRTGKAVGAGLDAEQVRERPRLLGAEAQLVPADLGDPSGAAQPAERQGRRAASRDQQPRRRADALCEIAQHQARCGGADEVSVVDDDERRAQREVIGESCREATRIGASGAQHGERGLTADEAAERRRECGGVVEQRLDGQPCALLGATCDELADRRCLPSSRGRRDDRQRIPRDEGVEPVAHARSREQRDRGWGDSPIPGSSRFASRGAPARPALSAGGAAADRVHRLRALELGLSECIGCGCPSLERCELANPGDRVGADGPGPRYWVGDRGAATSSASPSA